SESTSSVDVSSSLSSSSLSSESSLFSSLFSFVSLSSALEVSSWFELFAFSDDVPSLFVFSSVFSAVSEGELSFPPTFTNTHNSMTHIKARKIRNHKFLLFFLLFHCLLLLK